MQVEQLKGRALGDPKDEEEDIEVLTKR